MKLDVIAKPWSLAASGMRSASERSAREWSSYSRPSGSQVSTRWWHSERNWSASSVAATLSGLLPDRAKDTSRVGRSSAKYSSGLETISVVATASTRRPVRRESAGARISPAKADVPAPVRTTRSPGRPSSGRRKRRCRRGATRRLFTSRQTAGCWAISRAVARRPAWRFDRQEIQKSAHLASSSLGGAGERVVLEHVADAVEDESFGDARPAHRGGRARTAPAGAGSAAAAECRGPRGWKAGASVRPGSRGRASSSGSCRCSCTGARGAGPGPPG